jgi:ubiquinone biosynthesis protein COQ4
MLADMTSFDGRIRPVKALRAFRALMLNKEDAQQVVHFRTAIDGDWHEPMYQRVKASAEGAKLIATNHNLFDTLCDRDYLASLPEGSLGRTYNEELLAEGISPEGFRDADIKAQDFSLLGPERAFVHYRLIDMHDLLHTVTGYGRDGLGEICILEFQGVQFKSRGLRTLSYLAIVEAWRLFPGTPAWRCIREANKVAKSAVWMATVDWEAQLVRPLDEVRRTLGIELPELYLSRYDEWQEQARIMRAQVSAAG